MVTYEMEVVCMTKFNDMKYTRPDFDETKSKMDNLVSRMKQAQDAETFLKAFWEMNEVRRHLYTMITLVSIRHSINTADEFYDAENDYWDETTPQYSIIENELTKTVLEAPFREELLKEIPETYFQLGECAIKSFDPKIVPLLIEENKLTSEYGKLKSSAKISFDGEVLNLSEIQAKGDTPDRQVRKGASEAKAAWYQEHEAQFDEIYDKLVKLRDQMAKELGYNNYVELGYYRMNRLDYNAEMVAGYRKQILDYVTPAATRLYEKQRERIGYDHLAYYDLGFSFKSGNAKPHGNPDELVSYAVKMYHEMSEETGAFIDVMNSNQLWDLVSRPNKVMGGYETELYEYDVPFIFSNFNGTKGDVDVLTHEAGHAFQAYMADQIPLIDVKCPTMESAEIDSMSMEFFAYPWMNLFFQEEADKYRYSHMMGTITFLPYGVLVDHFQQEVYEHPEMTPAERKACWRKLEKMYLPFKDYEGTPLFEEGAWWYQQDHIFESPFYYIDYTLAQVCAQQFFIRMDEKDPTYWEDYKKLLRLGGTLSFTKLVKEAGLKVPFEEGTVQEIVSYLENYLNKIDDKAL